jgi:hypothetical protein
MDELYWKKMRKPTTNSAINKRDMFIVKATEVHGDKYEYDNIPIDFNSKDYVTITCKLHGDFIQRADSHLYGRHCPVCASKRQLRNRTFK